MVVGRASSKYGEAEGVAAGSGCGRGLGCRGRAAEGVSALLASGGLAGVRETDWVRAAERRDWLRESWAVPLWVGQANSVSLHKPNTP